MSSFAKFFFRLEESIHILGGYSKTARAAGVTERAARNWIDLKHNPRFTHCAAIADAAGVSLDWLAGREGAVRQYSVDSNSGQNPERGIADSCSPNTVKCIDIAVWSPAARTVDYVTFRAEVLGDMLRLPPSELCLVPVSDDAAAPVLSYGGVCIVHRRAAAADGIWAFKSNEAGTAHFREVTETISGDFIMLPVGKRGKDERRAQTVSGAAIKKKAIGRVVWGDRFFK